MIARNSLIVSLALAPATLQAAEGAPAVADSAGQIVFGLAVVLGLLFGFLWLLKRVGVARGGVGALRVLGAATVGPRERVVLVEVADKVLVLGVAPGSVRTLHTLDASQLASLPGPAMAPAGGKDFPAWLRQALERKGHA